MHSGVVGGWVTHISFQKKIFQEKKLQIKCKTKFAMYIVTKRNIWALLYDNYHSRLFAALSTFFYSTLLSIVYWTLQTRLSAYTWNHEIKCWMVSRPHFIFRKLKYTFILQNKVYISLENPSTSPAYVSDSAWTQQRVQRGGAEELTLFRPRAQRR